MATQILSNKEIDVVAGSLFMPGLNAGATLGPSVTPVSGIFVYAPNFVLHVIQRGGHNFWSRAR